MGKRVDPRNFIRAVALVPVVMVVFSAAAHADPNFPPRKAGLWQTTMTMKNMTMNGQKMPGPMGPPGGIISASCVDPANDLKLMKRAAAGEHGCAPPVFSGGGDHYTMADSCNLPDGTQMSMNGSMTYVSDEEVTVETQMSSTKMSGDMHMDSKWVGACPAGIVPGDFGMMMNGTFHKTGNVNNVP